MSLTDNCEDVSGVAARELSETRADRGRGQQQ